MKIIYRWLFLNTNTLFAQNYLLELYYRNIAQAALLRILHYAFTHYGRNV